MSDERFFDRLYGLRANDEVRDHYDRFAATYDDELVGRGYAQPDRVADAVVSAGVAVNASILDAGCGTGLSGRALANRGFTNIVGCDYSTEMLARAEQTGVYASVLEVDLNAESVDVAGSPFDVVTAVGILGHGHVAGSAIAGLVALLRPGGLFAMGINSNAWPDGDAKPALEELEGQGLITEPLAVLGDHIPGLDSQGWLITTQRV